MSKAKREFNSKVYISRSNFKIEHGRFISKGTQWTYVLFKNGNVGGFKDEIVFSDKNDALEDLIKNLKEKIIIDAKTKVK